MPQDNERPGTTKFHQRHKQRGLLLTVFVAVAALILAACGGGSDEPEDNGSESAAPANDELAERCPLIPLDEIDEKVTIEIWTSDIGVPARVQHAIAEKYNTSQDKVEVKFQYQGNFQEQLAKFQASMTNINTLPGIVIPDDTATQFMADSGVTIPADACIAADPDSAEAYDDMVPIIRAAYSIEDVMWPAAFSVAGAAMYVNETLLTQAGVDPEWQPQTFAELREVAEQIKAANLPGIEHPLVMRIDSWPLEFFINGSGAEVVNNSNGRDGLATESTYNNETTQQIWTFLQGMHADGLLNYIDYTDEIGGYINMAFQRSAIMIDSSSAISTVDAAIQGTLDAEQLGLDQGIDLSGVLDQIDTNTLQIDIRLIPGLEQAGQGQIGGGAWHLVAHEDPAVVSAAWDFLKFFNDVPQQITWGIESSYFPVRDAATDSPEFQEFWDASNLGRWMGSAYQGFVNLDPSFPGPVIGPYNEFRLAVKNGMEAVILNGADVNETLAQVDAEIQSAIDAYNVDVGA